MANPEDVAKLKEGVSAWNAWRHENPDLEPDLSDLNIEQELGDTAGTDVDLATANLSWTTLCNSALNGANLSEANLNGAILSGADLSHADLRGATLSGADLSDAVVRRADLSEAVLFKADLRRADCSRANLSAADLRQALLCDAILGGADLRDANLSRADLSNADFEEIVLRRAEGTFFAPTRIGWTIFGDVDLSTVKAIDRVDHGGPCTIGIDTLNRSRGNIPEPFLRGCGFRDWEVEAAKLYGPALTSNEIIEITYRIHAIRAGQPLQFHSCFISYATADESFAHRIHNSLEREGVRCWFAPDDMKAGRKLHDQIVEAIQFHDKLLLILSPASMKSEWVKEEILNAWTREKREKRAVLFPIALCSFEELRSWKCFDADTGRDVAREIREYYVPTNFGEVAKYESAFKKLCAALLKAAATSG